MSNNEISAFEAYAVKKSKKKQENGMSLKIKTKHKLKKKKKANHNINTVVESLIKSAECNHSDNLMKRNEKINKQQLIKSLLENEKESIFKNFNLTASKVNNIFLKENEYFQENSSTINPIEKKKIKKNRGSVGKTNFKQSKKKKVLNSESSRRYESQELSNKNVEYFNVKENREGKIKYSDTERDTEIIQSQKKEKTFKELSEEKFKLPKLLYSDSVKMGQDVFSWLLNPMEIKDFFNNSWEQKPLHIKHNNENYFKNICSMKDFGLALRDNDIYFTKNIDITSYVNGERFTENPEGKAKPSVVWDLYKNGKSVRLLNPQTFIPNIRLLNTTLQEFFQCFVGANIYLTPPGSQGFAPHYDDIEAFVLQLEGKKHWKLYNSRTPTEVLPRESSANFCEDELGEPILEVTLCAGDLLYFPRGIIHQAKCLPHVHSLHITISCYQKNSWADLLEKILPVALEKAVNEDIEFRKGLPIGYLNHFGMIYDDHESEQRQHMIKKFTKLAQKVIQHCPLDAAVDQLGASFMQDALPPCLTEEEKLYGADRDLKIIDKCFLDALKNYSDKDLSVKLIRGSSVRLVSELDEMILYHTTDNSLVYREHAVGRVNVSPDYAQAIDFLIHSYPKFVEMKELPVSKKVNTLSKWKRISEFVYFLWQRGLLLFDRPIQQIYI